MQFDVDSYKPSATVNKKGHTIYVGKENDRCWRKDVCKGVEFYYYNVPTENKEKYDMLFDSIKIINWTFASDKSGAHINVNLE